MESKEIVHELYNDISKNSETDMEEVKEVLLKVYNKLDRVKDDAPLINRLANFLYFKAFTEKLKFTRNQEELINKLAQIGGRAGLNGAYRSDYSSKGQFD
ncbi:immunity protein [Listeria kieliensis]|uniref:Immunity protein n=2 Tax=Listeria kieliensis TaxID=1621700 RepID=A0A3D8TS11_9LIST|nr:immunity protein [Listeria kieliensis]